MNLRAIQLRYKALLLSKVQNDFRKAFSNLCQVRDVSMHYDLRTVRGSHVFQNCRPNPTINLKIKSIVGRSFPWRAIGIRMSPPIEPDHCSMNEQDVFNVTIDWATRPRLKRIPGAKNQKALCEFTILTHLRCIAARCLQSNLMHVGPRHILACCFRQLRPFRRAELSYSQILAQEMNYQRCRLN